MPLAYPLRLHGTGFSRLLFLPVSTAPSAARMPVFDHAALERRTGQRLRRRAEIPGFRRQARRSFRYQNADRFSFIEFRCDHTA